MRRARRGGRGGLTGFALPQSGLCEIIVQLESASAATGLYLGDDQPRRVLGLRATAPAATSFWNSSSRMPMISKLKPLCGKGDPLRGRRSMAASRVGLRNIKCWVSGDGRHWGLALDRPGRFGNLDARWAVRLSDRCRDEDRPARHPEIRESD